MTSNSVNHEDDGLKKWLQSKSIYFLKPGDEIRQVVHLKSTINTDPNSAGLGLTFGLEFEIQPKAIFIVSDLSGHLNFGIIEISGNAIGLKDVGILHTYAKIALPKYALLLCKNSFSRELTYLLTDPIIGPRLLEYAPGRSLDLLDFN